jgi:hypothetical protein
MNTNPTDPIIMAAVESMLGQIATLRVTGITYTQGQNQGTVAHVTVEGGTHEILCELTEEGQLLSARVIET